MSQRRVLTICICLIIFIFQACTTGDSNNDNKSKDSVPLKSDHQNKGPYNYSVYLENSGSLNGYLNVGGDGSFKDAVYSLITGINGFEEKKTLNLYDVNTVVIPVARNASASQVNDYISNLDAATFKSRSDAKGGNQAKSDLRDVFKKVLDSTSGNTVSILISDCIFSPEKGSNALDYLSQQKAGIQGFFQEKLARQPLATLMLQFRSDFNGAYYYNDNSSKTAAFKSRPYYIACIGPENALRDLYNYVESRFHSKGFQDFAFLTPENSYDVHPAIVMNTVYYNYEPDKPLLITGAQKGGKDNKFSIRVKTDFAALPVSEAYLGNPANYEVTPGYVVESVQPVKDDKGHFTHEIVLTAPTAQAGTVRLALRTKLPDWVAATNLDADKGMTAEELENKTFGIRYLVGGIYDAYYARQAQPEYFSFTITVKN